MSDIRPIKERAMVTGEGGFGMDVRPFDRKVKEAQEKVRDKKLGFADVERLIRKLVLDS